MIICQAYREPACRLGTLFSNFIVLPTDCDSARLVNIPKTFLVDVSILYTFHYLKGLTLEMPLPQARRAVTDAILESSGYWTVGGEGRARQALKHVLARCERKFHMPTMNQLHPR